MPWRGRDKGVSYFPQKTLRSQYTRRHGNHLPISGHIVGGAFASCNRHGGRTQCANSIMTTLFSITLPWTFIGWAKYEGHFQEMVMIAYLSYQTSLCLVSVILRGNVGHLFVAICCSVFDCMPLRHFFTSICDILWENIVGERKGNTRDCSSPVPSMSHYLTSMALSSSSSNNRRNESKTSKGQHQ